MEKKRQKIKPDRKRIITSLVLVLFAAIMAGTAVYAPVHAKGWSTSTGKDGRIPIIFTDYAKKYSNSGVASDCQGFYFYVTPVDPLQTETLNYFPESAETLFEGSLARTDVKYVDENGKEKNRTFREYFEKEEEEMENVRYRWIQDYNIARFQGYTSVIPQTHESLLFVPYATWTGVWNNSGSDNNQGALKSGWKNNISRICYYNRDASTIAGQYRSLNDERYLDNRVFLTQDVYHNVRDNKMSEFESLCKNGIFYTELAKLAVNKENADAEKNATELIEVNELWKRLDSPAKIKSFASNADLQDKSEKLWDYILTLDTSGGSLSFNGPSRIDEFLSLGYNNYYGKRNAAYSASNPIGMNLSGSKFKLEEWEGASPADELFVNNEFAQLEYNLHYLDLMLTIYATALKNGASVEVTNAWEQAVMHYTNGDGNEVERYRVFGPAAPTIAICGGILGRGTEVDENGDLINVGGYKGAIVYAGMQDMINIAYRLENAGTNVKTDLQTNQRSVTKSFLGTRTGGSADERKKNSALSYFMGITKKDSRGITRYKNTLNPEVLAKGAKFSGGGLDTKLKEYDLEYIKSVPDYYGDFYDRLKTAVMCGNTAGNISAIKNDEIIFEQSTWVSEIVQRRLLNTYYYRDSSGKVTEGHPRSGQLEAIKLVSQKEGSVSGSSDDYALYGYKNSWGCFYVPSFRFPWIEDPKLSPLTARLTSRLTVRSDLTAQQENPKNKSYEQGDFAAYNKYRKMDKNGKYGEDGNPDYVNSYKHHFGNKLHDVIANARPLAAEETFVNGELADSCLEPLADHVQLQANVVYGNKKDKEALKAVYDNADYSIDKDNLYVKVRLIRADELQMADGKEVEVVTDFNSSYLDKPGTIGFSFTYKGADGAEQTAVKKLAKVKELTRNACLSYEHTDKAVTLDVGCKVTKEQFEAVFFPKDGLVGAALTLDVDQAFFQDAGFEVPLEGAVYVGWQVEIIPCMITSAKEFANRGWDGDEVKELITAYPSNRAGIKYTRTYSSSASTVEKSPDYNYMSVAENYAELKEGEIRCFHLTPMRLQKLYEKNYAQPGSYLQNYNALKASKNSFEPKVYDVRGWAMVPTQAEISMDVLADNHEEIAAAVNPSLAPGTNDIRSYLDIQEQFEAMAGVPTTRSLYFSTGGSEFIVNLRLNYEANQKAERTYTSHFNGVDCEYKPGDQLKRLNSQGVISETFVADAGGKTKAYSVECEKNAAVEPEGYSSKNTTVSYHTSPTKFYAEWTGTIPNTTPEPGDGQLDGAFDPGKPGSPCAGSGYDKGRQRGKDLAATSWDVSGYNEALEQAVAWADAMEATNADWTVRRIADSDGWERKYAVGDAVIKVSLNVSRTNSLDGGGGAKTEVFGSRTLGTGNVTCKYGGHGARKRATEDAKSGGAMLQGTKEYLGSGWTWDKGEYGKGSGYVAGTHGHNGSCDCEDVAGCTAHECGEFTPGTDRTHGQSSASYTIRVEFTHGAFEGNNYDGSEALYDGLSPARAAGISQMPAHAICGPCCEHVLPAIEDTWTQTAYFDTVAITDMHVWKLESGYVQGVSEIFEGNEYYEKHQEELPVANEIFDAWDSGEADYYNDRGNWTSRLVSALNWQGWQYRAAGYQDLDRMDPEYLAVRDRVYATIQQSDPGIFYNIAAKNLEDYNVPYNTSRTGRLRYSLQTGQDDDVYWEEYTKSELTGAKELHRSNKCDGQDSTMDHCGDDDGSTGPNPSPNGGRGHYHPWSTGCLYTNNKYTNGVDYHKKYMYDGEKEEYNKNRTHTESGLGLGVADTERNNDAKDQKTQEWKRFDARRNMPVSVTVISDFLILQTSSGDQSPFYWESASETVTAQENFGQIDIDPTMDNGGGFGMMVTNNPLHMKMGTAVNVGSYNGRYDEPEEKYTGDGFYEGCPVIPTAFDDDAKKFPRTKDELAPYDDSCPEMELSIPHSGHAVKVSADQNLSCPGACFGGYGQLRHERVRGLVLSDNFVQNPTNVNGEYTTGKSHAFYRSIIQWTDGTTEEAQRYTPKDRRSGTDETRVRFWKEAAAGDYPDREFGEGMREFFLADRTDPLDAPSTAAPYRSTAYERMSYTDAGYMDNKGTGETRFIEDAAREIAGAVLPEDEVSSRYMAYLGYQGITDGYSYGILRESFYDRGQVKDKCNDIVVYDPVSVKYCRVLRKAKHIVNEQIAARYPADTERSWLYPEDMDQRIAGDYEGAGDMVDKPLLDERCPGVPGQCAFRKLVCRYDREIVRADFTMDDFERFYGGDGSSYDESWYSYYIKSGITNDSGVNPMICLDGSGFKLTGGEDRAVTAAGRASLMVPFGKLSIDSSNTSERVLVMADITINRGGKMPVFSTDHTRLFYDNGYLCVETDDGGRYRSTRRISTGRAYTIGLELCCGDLSEFRVYVDSSVSGQIADAGTRSAYAWSFTQTRAPSMYDEEVCGAEFYLGNRDDREYEVYLTADNLSVIRLGGTRDHTAACYETVKRCPTVLQDLYNGLKAGSTGIDWYGYENDGSDVISTTSVSHDHKDSCLDADGAGFAIAYEEGKTDCTALEKMTGPALWNRIVKKFNLKKKNGEYTLNVTNGSNRVRNYGYTGTIQSVTLEPGSYMLEAWGASGTGGAGGGYSNGTINLNSRTTLYIGVGGTGTKGGGVAPPGTVASGGYNGGGSGGGASHIALSSGLLSSLSGNRGSILLVAGGGGGAGSAGNGTKSGTTYFTDRSGNTAYTFTAGADGEVTFFSTSWTADPWGYIYVNGDMAASDDDSGSQFGRLNFYCSAQVRAGDSIRLVAGAYGAEGSCDWTCTYPSEARAGGAGGGANMPGGNGSGMGATLTGGYAFGQGGPAGLSGGGYYGGMNGGGGSGYADAARLSDITGESGVNMGNGYVRITELSCVDKEGLFAYIQANRDLIPDYVTTDRRSIVNPIWACRCRYDNGHVCTDACWSEELACTEPHHAGGHYDFSSAVCYEACGKDENHRQYVVEDPDHSDETVRADDFVLLDNYFDVYFPNLGEYYESDQYGILDTSAMRGKGYGMPYSCRKDPYSLDESYIHGRDYTDYVYRYGHYSGTDALHACSDWVPYADNPEVREGYHYINREDEAHQGRESIMHMDTTEWTREKWVKFPYITLYNRNGVWEEHAADEWYQIEIFDNDGEILDTYHFYCPLLNDEMGNAQVQYAVESINHPFDPEIHTYPEHEDTGIDMRALEEEFREGIRSLEDITLAADQEIPKSVAEWLGREPLTITDVLMYMYYARHWEAAKRKLLEYYQDYTMAEQRQMADENWPVFAINADRAWPLERDDMLSICGPMDGANIMNDERYSYLTGKKYGAWQDVWNDSYIDVIGHIGNLVMDDTDDLRFSNFFKVSTRGWLIDGLVSRVDQSKQNRYLSWWRNPGLRSAAGVPGNDIRCEAAGPWNEWYNTYHTQEWTNIEGKTAAQKDSIPVQASGNNLAALRNYQNELRLGYNVLWDISSIGNYEMGTLQVLPYYYALNIKTGELVPVDVYIDSGEQIRPINYFGLMDEYASVGNRPKYTGVYSISAGEKEKLAEALYNYNMHLDWRNEAAGEKNRRNYFAKEKSITEALAKEKMFGAYVYEPDGTPVTVPIEVSDIDDNGNTSIKQVESQLVYSLTIPFGGEIVLGNSQLIRLSCKPDKDELDGGRARTFIGTSRVTALHGDINLHDETNLGGNDPLLYARHGQRWHLTLGLPSSAQFVAYRNGVRNKPNALIEKDGELIYAVEELKADARGNCDWVILMTADIKVMGAVYNLQYSQGSDNGMYEAQNGNKFYFGDDIPTVIGVYGIGNTTTPDIDIMQTH